MEFSQVYVDYKHKIYSYVYYRVDGDRDAAEDVVSDIFVKAYRHFHRYDARYAISTWLYAIAKNTLIDYYRKKRDMVAVDELELPDTTDPLYVLLNAELHEADLAEALKQIPEKQREYIERQFFTGETAKSIAEKEGVSHVAVRKQVSRGVAALRELLLSIALLSTAVLEL